MYGKGILDDSLIEFWSRITRLQQLNTEYPLLLVRKYIYYINNYLHTSYLMNVHVKMNRLSSPHSRKNQKIKLAD